MLCILLNMSSSLYNQKHIFSYEELGGPYDGKLFFFIVHFTEKLYKQNM